MKNKNFNILLVEDNAGDVRLFREYLLEADLEKVKLDHVERLSESLEHLSREKPDVILLDLGLPDSQGLATFIKLNVVAPEVPIVVLTGMADTDQAVEAVQAGAQDYLVKAEVSSGLLVRAIQYAIERKRIENIAEARLHLLKFADDHSLDELLQETLEMLENLTGSRIGFYHFVEADQQSLTLQSWSRRTLQEMCKAESKTRHYPIAEAGVWADCLRERRSVIHNDYSSLPDRKGVPEGHAEIVRELVVPVFRGDKIMALLGVGNKPQDYSEDDVKTVSNLADLVWDVTEQKRAIGLIRESEARLRKAQHFAHVGSWTWHIKTDQLDWSDEMYAIFGLNKETFSGLLTDVIEKAIHPDDRPEVDRANLSVIQSGKPIPLEYRIIWPDGSVRAVWAEAAELLRDETGAPSELSGTVRDITESKRLDETLRLQGIALNAAANAIILTDRDGLIEWVNPAFSALTGYSSEEVVGRNPRDLVKSGYQSLGFYKKLWDTILDDRIWQGELVNRRKDGSLYTEEQTITPMKDDHGKISHFIAIKQDITARKQVEIELIKYREHLEDLVRERTSALEIARQQADAANQAKGDFLAVMSHEIRTPLNGVLGLAYLLQQTELNNKQRNYLANLQVSGEALLFTVNDILDFSKIDSGKLIIENINFSLQDVLQKLSSVLAQASREKGLDIVFMTEPDVPQYLIGDPTRLEQTLLNLLTNAIKFTHTGGVRIHTRLFGPAVLDAEMVTLKFSVSDTGIGMTADQISHLFQPFSQADSSTSRKYGGSGLGLVISQRLVNLMGGELRVESQPGHGSTFSFTLKFGRQSSEQNETTQNLNQFLSEGEPSDLKNGIPSQSKQIADGEKLYEGRILLVEDNRINQLVAVDIIEKMGFQVSIADNGEEGFEKLKVERFDAVLMDIQMPGMDGYQATRQIRQFLRYDDNRLPIIAMTANAMKEDRQRAEEAGMDDYISKPIDIVQLSSVLSHWVKPRQPAQAKTPQEDNISNVRGQPGSQDAIDMASALARLNNNKKLYRQIISMFQAGHADDIGKIRAALQENDLDKAIRIAHDLKGLAGTVGANELRTSTKDLETAISEANSTAYTPALEQTKQKLEAVLVAIARMEEET